MPLSPVSTRPLHVGIVTLGCDKNTVDNEYLAGLLEAGGCRLVVDGEAADGPLDAVVVTTCGFIDRARQQSIDTIVELAERKRATGNPRRLFVAGCLSQRHGAELMEEIPEIDGLVGVGQFRQLANLILNADRAEARTREVAETPTVDIYQLMHRRRLQHTPHAFLKISDGCNHACTFCSIPAMKGKLRSVPREILLAEAERLLADGVREINLVAQDLSMYGMDRWRDVRLPDLLRDLCALPGEFWIRCLYFYPGNVTDDFLEVMAAEPKIVPYLDMPLQHLHPETLRRMRRPFHEVKTFELVERLRAAVPGLTLRTTMIVGFPGETRSEHEFMLEGIRRLRFERLGAFQYSDEEGTPSATMRPRVRRGEKERRWHAVMAAQAEIAAEHSRARVGRRERVLVESHEPHAGCWIARGAAEAPEIDARVFVWSATPLTPGQFIDVEINRADGYDVHASPVAG